MSGVSDRDPSVDVLARARAGDARAFRAIYDGNAPLVYGFLRRMLGEGGAAEDAVLGTEFDVEVEADAVEVRVVRGEVEVRNRLGRRRLWRGETARARAGEAPRFVQPIKAVVLEGPPEIVAPSR